MAAFRKTSAGAPDDDLLFAQLMRPRGPPGRKRRNPPRQNLQKLAKLIVQATPRRLAAT
jgi:hypothetical protein